MHDPISVHADTRIRRDRRAAGGKRARFTPSSRSLTFHPQDTVRIRQVRGHRQPVEVRSRARDRGRPLAKEQDGTLVRERHEARDARLPRALRRNNAARAGDVSHTPSITEGL